MNLPSYETNVRAEAGWLGVSAALGTLGAALANSLGADAQLSGAVAVVVTAVSRAAIGALLPS